MSEKTHGAKNPSMHGKILCILGALLVIVGLGIINIHNPLRGSGLGTLSTGTGVVMIIIGVLRLRKLRK
jgi:hypothetical protein